MASELRTLQEAFQQALNTHDVAKMGALLAEDVMYWEANLPQPLKGRKAVQDHYRENWKAFPDASLRFTATVEGGDRIAGEGTWSATNKGPITMPGQPPVPATGKRAEGRFASVARVEKGKVKELNIYYDNMQFLAQLGLIPPPGSRPR